MTALSEAIRACEATDREEIVREIRNHIAEATAAGKPLSVVLESLGSADALARAYAVELVLHPKASSPLNRVTRFATTAALVALGSVTTILVVGALASLGVGLVASGLAMFVIGLLEAGGIHLPGVETAGLAPVWIVSLGPVVFGAGLASLVGLRVYVRFLVRTLRTALPGRRGLRAT